MFHKTLTQERWVAMSMETRLLHIGAELHRLEGWLTRGNVKLAQQSAERALELLDLSVAAADPGPQRREFCRLRELVAGFYVKTDNDPVEVRALRRVLIGNL